MKTILDMVKSLNSDDKTTLAEQIMQMLAGDACVVKEKKGQSLIAEVQHTMPNCPHCEARSALGYIIKRGMCRGSQRYFCKSCGKYFVPSTKTAFERTRKGADVWRKFIQMTITGASLKACSQECGIAYQTAFTWRHKVLNAFQAQLAATQMGGQIELDEMLIPISYKGNHIKGAFGEKRVKAPHVDTGLPRRSFQRGSDNKSLSPKNKACVVCMVENGSHAFYGAVPGVGFMQPPMLDAVVGKHVNKDTALLLVDHYRVTLNYLQDNNYNFIALSSNTSDNPRDHKPEIVGDLHLQHINALHRHIRRFLAGYCGVSSKYLGNYIALFMWLKNIKAKRQSRKIESVSIRRMSFPDCYVSWDALRARPAIPACA